MQPCPQCQTLLESWEVICHSCGKVLSLEQVPVVGDVAAPEGGLKEALEDWLDKGRDALARKEYDEAAVCFQLALKRGKGLADQDRREVELRSLLAQALEKDGKLAEAAEQYRVILDKAADLPGKSEMEQKAKLLQDNAVVDALVPTGGNSFQAAEAFELKVVPLYCGCCKRRLTEAELYGFRKGLVASPRCLCGHEGPPMVKRTVEHIEALKEEERRSARRKKLIEAASGRIEGGKSRTVAAMLAIFAGFVGAHKFYLGERAAGIWSVVFCWTFIPWLVALFEATSLLSMSDVGFNLSSTFRSCLRASLPNRLPSRLTAASSPWRSPRIPTTSSTS